jgi:lipopolysaccharide heptosyltransferase II
VRAAWAPWLARIPVRVGFAGRGPLLTHGVTGWKPWRRRHRSAWYGLLARPFGAEAVRPLALTLPEAERQAARTLLGALGRRRGRPLVVLEPGASYGSAKCWPAERFGEVAARLLAEGADVLTVGLAGARPLERRLAERAGPGLLSAVGRTPSVALLAGVLAEADLLVANDTGPMHLAAALGTPVLAVFGATDPVVSGPAGHGPRGLVFEPEPCSPCFLRTCPVPGHPCLTKIPAERVLAAARAMLAAGRAPSREPATRPPPRRD